MDKKRIAGGAKKAKGTAKIAAGKATGNAKLKAKGKAEKKEGRFQQVLGGLKDAVRRVTR